MSVSEDRTVQSSPTTPAPVSGIADPAPLGLAAFALTTFLLSARNAGWMTSTTGNAWLPFALAYGGLAQLLAAMWEFRNRNVVGTTGFGTFGAFWIGLGFYILLVVNPARRGRQAAHAAGDGHEHQPRPRLDPARVCHLHHLRADPDQSDERGLVHHLPPPVDHLDHPGHRVLQGWRSAPARSHNNDQDRRLPRRGHRGSPPGTPRRRAWRPAWAASSGSPWARRSSSEHPDRVGAWGPGPPRPGSQRLLPCQASPPVVPGSPAARASCRIALGGQPRREESRVHDVKQIDLSAQVERVKRKTRPWKSIIALLLAIAAAVISHRASHDRSTFVHDERSDQPVRRLRHSRAVPRFRDHGDLRPGREVEGAARAEGRPGACRHRPVRHLARRRVHDAGDHARAVRRSR